MHRKIQAKQTVFLRRLFLRNKTKNIKTKINNVYLKYSVVAQAGLLGDTIIVNLSTQLSKCENKEKSKKTPLKTLVKQTYSRPFVTSQISTRLQREQPRGTGDLTNQHARTSHVIISFLYPVFLLSIMHIYTNRSLAQLTVQLTSFQLGQLAS